MNKIWQTSKRQIDYSQRTLVMAILNATPDSFSDGGKFLSVDQAVKHVEKLIDEGADIIDVGGESTRPGSKRVSIPEEIDRVVPVISAISDRFDIPISIDTSKSEVAETAIQNGAEIINDVSGLKFDQNIAKVAAKYDSGLVLMHLSGSFSEMHLKLPDANILTEVTDGLYKSIHKAKEFGVSADQICLDVGIGFSKTFEQNLELIGKLGELIEAFSEFPMLIGTSRKSFIGKIMNDSPPDQRLYGTIASNAIACWNGVNIVRVHDVKQTVQALKVVEAIKGKL